MHATEIGALQVQAAAALGRHAEALAVVGRTRQGRRRFALEAAEALLGLMRPRGTRPDEPRAALGRLRRRHGGGAADRTGPGAVAGRSAAPGWRGSGSRS